MKIATSLLAAVVFTGTLGALNNAVAQDGILSKDEFGRTGYCHMTFPAIAHHPLGNDQPELSSKGAVIDFYGPCGENPLGKDQIQAQKLENQQRWEREYESE